MTDGSAVTAAAGWYPDAGDPTRLRWWDGAAWTQHFAPRPDGAPSSPAATATMPATTKTPATTTATEATSAATTSTPAATTSAATMPSTSALQAAASSTSEAAAHRYATDPTAGAVELFSSRRAEPALTMPAISSRSPLSAMTTLTPMSPVANEEKIAEAARTEALLMKIESGDEDTGVLTRSQASDRWQELVSMPPRAVTGSAWALAASPWIVLFSAAAVATQTLTGSASLWVLLACIALPALWVLAFAERDRRQLSEWGHSRTASTAWILLGPLPYLVARTLRVRRESGTGTAPLLGLGLNVAVIAGLIVGAVSTLPSWWSPHAAEIALEAALLSGGQPLDVSCPDQVDVSPNSTFACAVEGGYGTSGVIVVDMADYVTDFSYDVALGPSVD